MALTQVAGGLIASGQTITSPTITSPTISGNANMTGGTKYQVGGVTTNALAWANFTNSGSAITVRASYNISSFTFSAAYSFTMNFTNALSDANYVVIGTSGDSGGSSTTGHIGTYTPSNSSISSKTTSAVALYSVAFNNSNPAYFDNNIVVFGN